MSLALYYCSRTTAPTGPFDPATVPLAELKRIRGAIWPNCHGELVLPLGPRPGQPDNICAPTYLDRYPVDLWEPIAAMLRGRGYWTVDMGPSVGDYTGYHGQFPPVTPWPVDASPAEKQRHWDLHLSVHDWWWQHGFSTVEFLHPDGWTFEQTRDFFTPLLDQPRSRQLLRIVVPTGWEPAKYEWSNATWCQYFTWIRDLLPDALCLVHLTTDIDAPVGTDALEPVAVPNGTAWDRIIHAGCDGWLLQNGPYSSGPDADPDLAQHFAAQFMATGLGAALHSVAWHFQGNAGWPYAPSFLLINAECTSYTGYWNNLPEPQREAWGDLAMQSGADAYFDGGTVGVGSETPPPWVR
jgi:hypothetical protein